MNWMLDHAAFATRVASAAVARDGVESHGERLAFVIAEYEIKSHAGIKVMTHLYRAGRAEAHS